MPHHKPRSVIIDVGSLHTKAGFDGESTPRVIATLLAKQKITHSSTRNVLMHLQNPLVSPKKEYMIGKEIKNQSAMNMALFHPVERGKFKDLKQLEKLWDYMYETELKVSTSDCNLLIADNIFNPEENRQREHCAQILFESLKVPSLFFEHQSVLSMFGAGKLTGVLIDSGYGITHTIPFFEGIPLRDAIEVSNFGSQDLDQFLMNCLINLSDNLKINQIKQCIKNIKEELCFIKADPLAHSDCKPYELPDGTMVALRNELFEGGELFFKHQLADKSFHGIHQMAHRSILKCEPEIRKDLYSNVVLTGGNCKLFGIEHRLKREMKSLTGKQIKIHSTHYHDKECLSFIGGSIITSISTMDEAWITKKEWDEIGPDAFIRKGTIIID
ncbi:hypothetical protein NAEGRDRAFT_44602 [Naegleria gruberi]|uniref:Actin n=1 Tax=Naegleria gruberi TaxID=5762 RepID=D2VHV9_NAEGR|nr:uncharacterized protein NAEGRDRAFT_44602 [Naegleria gruberi]EFC43660.1 hypothetical protein NAEGRDRAFT_44602 [Naegleria gruberi]|eukprot:XP_002676404.1 hypothetical protein NAEGRDRAFT_44602 [Naegleria gruberi strain NEG-M]